MTDTDETEQAHLQLSANRVGRDFLVGDLHGMYTDFLRALEERRFDPARDRVVSVGDLVDRGPDSPACLKLLDEPWFYAVRGNHEQLMLDVLDGYEDASLWAINGGDWGLAADFEDELAAPLARARRLPHALTLSCPEGHAIGITHAEYPRADWAEVDSATRDPHAKNAMLWGRRVIHSDTPQDTANIALTVHGHTPIRSPLRLGTALFIDTGAVYGGVLTLMTAEEALRG